MCMEDYLISKSIVKQQFTVPVALIAIPICQADPDRCALVISTDGAAAVWIGEDASTAVGHGMILKTTDPPLRLNVWHHGNWVRGGIWAIGAAAGPTNVCVMSSSFELELFLAYKKAYMEGGK